MDILIEELDQNDSDVTSITNDEALNQPIDNDFDKLNSSLLANGLFSFHNKTNALNSEDEVEHLNTIWA